MSRPSETPELPSLDSRPRCCEFSSVAVSCITAAMMLGIGAAAYFLGRHQASSLDAASNHAQVLSEAFPLINATASVSSEKYSMATGDVSDDAEGLFVLDHNSGLLQCSVIYPRVGRFMGMFSINVAETLGAGAKGGQYLMVTGRAQFPRASNNPAAPTLVYVMDSATGNYACYGIPFDHTAVPRAQPQQGLMVLIATGTANPVIDRDKLR